MRGALVEAGDAAGRMDDEHAAVARLPDDLVERAGQFDDAAGGRFAPMVVPHVAEDERGLLRVPLGGFLDGDEHARLGFLARTEVETERAVGSRSRGDHGEGGEGQQGYEKPGEAGNRRAR